MKITKAPLKIAASILAACGVSCGFTACYGMPVNFNELDLNFHVSGDINGDGIKEDVPGIRITEKSSSLKATTGTNGNAEIFSPSPDYAEFEIEDVDGPSNGTFKTRAYNLPKNFDGNTIEIELERDTDA